MHQTLATVNDKCRSTNATTWLMANHSSTVEWFKAKFADMSVKHITQLTEQMISQMTEEDTVVGTLPAHWIAQLTAKGIRYAHIEFAIPKAMRGIKLTAEQLNELAPSLKQYEVVKTTQRLSFKAPTLIVSRHQASVDYLKAQLEDHIHVEHLTNELNLQGVEQLVGNFPLHVIAKLQKQGKRCFVIHFATPPLGQELLSHTLQQHAFSFEHFDVMSFESTLTF